MFSLPSSKRVKRYLDKGSLYWSIIYQNFIKWSTFSIKIPSNYAIFAAEILVLRSLLIIEEILTHHLLIMIAVAEIGPTNLFITSF